jgi:hypothetical protein
VIEVTINALWQFFLNNFTWIIALAIGLFLMTHAFREWVREIGYYWKEIKYYQFVNSTVAARRRMLGQKQLNPENAPLPKAINLRER